MNFFCVGISTFLKYTHLLIVHFSFFPFDHVLKTMQEKKSLRNLRMIERNLMRLSNNEKKIG